MARHVPSNVTPRLVLAYTMLCLVIGLGVDFLVQYELGLRYRQLQKVDTTLRAGAIRAQLEGDITANLLLVHGMAGYIAVHPDLDQEQFSAFARELMQGPSLLKNLGAAPDYVLTLVPPLEGNESILGMDYRDMPDQREQAGKPERTGRMELAGPLDLIQGGRGLIGRVPVFVSGPDGVVFWGLVSSVIDADQLLSRAGFSQDHSDLALALRGADGLGAEGRVFSGDPDLFDPGRRALLMDVALPSGSWQLAVLPREGWAVFSPLAPYVHVATGILALAALLLALQRTKTLRKLSIVRENLKEAQSIAHLGSWEHNPRTGDLYFSDEVYAILGLDKETFIPTVDSFLERLHPEDRPTARENYKQSLANKTSRRTTYRIIRPDGELRWIMLLNENRMDASGRATRLLGVIQDITERKQAEIALQEQEEKLRSMSQASHDALIMIDSQDVVSFWNPAAERLFGYSAEEALGNRLHELVAREEDRRRAHAGLPQFERTGRGPAINTVEEFLARRKDGSMVPVERTVASFQLGGKWYAVGSVRDITERKQAQEELRRLATTDSLTGLPNRRYFMEVLEKAYKNALRYQRPLSVIMFDVDHFKKVNDTHGHDAGDEVLEFLGESCLEVFRETDTPGRLGGEEFAVVLPESDLAAAREAAERFRIVVREAVIKAGGTELRITVSLGLACLDGEARTVDALLKRADEALYRAKESGRDRTEG